MTHGLPLDDILFGEAAEGCVQLQPGEGEIPESIQGTYYLNGPANLRCGDFTYKHWLDGYGLIRALRLGEGRAEHTSRFVRSKRYVDEKEAGRPLYRAFGTAFDDDRLRRRITLESPVNVSVFQFGDHLLAFGEQSLPWELARNDLSTLGEFNFNGWLSEFTPLSAHPKIDVDAGRLCNFGLNYLLATTKLRYWEFDHSLGCVSAATLDLRAPYSVHDFVLSERFAAFYLSPYLLDIAAFIRKGRSIFDALAWRPEEGNELLLCERKSGDAGGCIPLGRRGYCLHLINGFDDGETLVVDLIETAEPLYPQYHPLPDLFATVKPCAFVRIRIDAGCGSIIEVVEAKQEVHLDFPALLPEARGRVYGQVWTLGMPTHPAGVSKYYDRILRFDWSRGKVVDRHLAPRGVYIAGEPAIVEGAGPGSDAFLICPRWHSAENRSDYLILNAFDLSAPPVAVLPLPHPSPLGFHSIFDPAG